MVKLLFNFRFFLSFSGAGGQFSAEGVDRDGPPQTPTSNNECRARDRRPTTFASMPLAGDLHQRHRRTARRFEFLLRLAQRIPQRISERARNQLYSRHD